MRTKLHLIRRWVSACAVALAFTLGTGPGVGVAAAEPAETSATSRALPGASVARPATAAEIDSYRQREARAPATLGEFTGGNTVVITASTLVAVLLIVLLVVLIV